MGTCLSKRGSFTVQHEVYESEAQVKLKRGNSKNEKGHLRKEIFIIKHKKEDIHDHECPQQQGSDGAFVETKGVLGMRASNCTKEEMDAILIHCGRLSRNNSPGKKPKYSSDSKRGFDFDHYDNDAISNDEDQMKTNDFDEIVCAEKHHQHRSRHRESSEFYKESSRRRTPSREREQCSSSSSRERRVSRSPGKRSSETIIPANASNNNSNINGSSRPERMVSVPASISYKSNGGDGGGEYATTTSVKRITVRRNVGAPSPRSQSPARTKENAANSSQLLSAENQQHQFSLCRNSSRKAEQSPYKRNTLSEVDPNTLAYPHSTANNNSSKVQIKPKKEIETDAKQKANVDINDNSKNWTNSRVEMDIMTAVPPEFNKLKPQKLTRTRSARNSRDLDHNSEAQLISPQSYTSMLLQDIQNFHQKNNTPSVTLPDCVTRACSILEAVADLNTTRNDYNDRLGSNHQYGKRVVDMKDPFIESEVVVSDDVMEPSLQKYVTFERSGSLSGVDTMEGQESSGSNSFTVSSGQQQQWRSTSCSSSRELNSFDSKDWWTSRMNHYSRERGSEKSTRLGRDGVMNYQ